MLNDFVIGKKKQNLYVINAYLIQGFCICSGGIYYITFT